MVDAVNAINAATQTAIQQKKTVSIDWRNLTANEVLEYAGKGEDVPPDILRWAQDYSKLTNAPDNVSYDAVNGATTQEEVNQQLTGTESSDTTGTEDAAEETAESEDEAPTENQVNLYEQGRILYDESNAASASVDTVTEDSGVKATTGEEIAVNAANYAEQVNNNAKSTKAEYDELVDKVKSNPKQIEPSDLLKLDKLADKLLGIGQQAQNNLNTFDIQLQEIDAVFSQYEPIPQQASDKGTETVEIGSKLVEDDPEQQTKIATAAKENVGNDAARAAMENVRRENWYWMFDRNYQMGLNDIQAGGGVMDKAPEGTEALNNAVQRNGESKTAVANAKDLVEEVTMAQSINNDVAQTDNSENTNTSDSGETQNSSATKTDLNGVKDSTLLTDAQEIEKRKINRGEVPPPTA